MGVLFTPHREKGKAGTVPTLGLGRFVQSAEDITGEPEPPTEAELAAKARAEAKRIRRQEETGRVVQTMSFYLGRRVVVHDMCRAGPTSQSRCGASRPAESTARRSLGTPVTV